MKELGDIYCKLCGGQLESRFEPLSVLCDSGKRALVKIVYSECNGCGSEFVNGPQSTYNKYAVIAARSDQ